MLFALLNYFQLVAPRHSMRASSALSLSSVQPVAVWQTYLLHQLFLGIFLEIMQIFLAGVMDIVRKWIYLQ